MLGKYDVVGGPVRKGVYELKGGGYLVRARVLSHAGKMVEIRKTLRGVALDEAERWLRVRQAELRQKIGQPAEKIKIPPPDAMPAGVSPRTTRVARVRPWERRVYFILDEANQALKIGIANDPMARLAAIQTGHQSQLRLLGSIEGSYHTERLIHARLKAYRIRGEWFRFEGAVRSFVDQHQEFDGAHPLSIGLAIQDMEAAR